MHAQRTRCHCPLEMCPAQRVFADANAELAIGSLHGNIASSDYQGVMRPAWRVPAVLRAQAAKAVPANLAMMRPSYTSAQGMTR